MDLDYDERKQDDKFDELNRAFNPSYYTSPEVIQKLVHTDRCDIWSIGAILYTIISG